ncbi:hypothetical protein [Clostridium gasigenes]|uniref:hypothetical protein n=1 Tax=Clostridium gasigenes TaxID=94869 RepID=UPI001C0BF9F8|nr:hypothetical protein [Clostridium gasigenes]MBU3106140.1 hypothetical protein [Clostridium gasigenes]
MRKINNVVDFEMLLKEDEDLQITKTGIIEWLGKFKPYTNEILNEITNTGIEKYPSIVQEYAKYVRELGNKEINIEFIIDKRIKNILELLYNYKKTNRVEFLQNYSELMKVIYSAFNNMVYMSSKAQAQNTMNNENISKKDIIMIHMDILKDTIEGVLNKLLSPIIFILERKENLNVNVEEIDRRYFSQKYYNYKCNENYKTIQKDFSMLFIDTNNSLRNADAHFDYKIDSKNEIITYKTGRREAPSYIETTYTELIEEIKKLSSLANQIAIAYELFAYQLIIEIPDLHTEFEFEFDQDIIALNQCLLPYRITLKEYTYNDLSLILYIKNLSNMNIGELVIFLLRWSINYLELAEKYEEDVQQIVISIINERDITINRSLVEELRKNTNTESFELFIERVLDSNGY